MQYERTLYGGGKEYSLTEDREVVIDPDGMVQIFRNDCQKQLMVWLYPDEVAAILKVLHEPSL